MGVFALLEADAVQVENSLKGCIRAMKFIVVGLIGGITLWASVTSIQGAVIASGLVISEGNKKLVQHRDGGVIAELLIKDGQQVSKDDVLIRLDGRQLGSELDAIEKKLGELRLRKLRLTAEAEALPEEGLVRQLSGQLGRESNKGLDDFIRNQISLYKSRAWNHASKFEMLNKRIAALQIELKGSKDLLGAKKEELELIEKELGLLTTLEAKSLVSLSRIAPLRRERARIVGELARNKTRVAKIPEQLAEAKAEIAEAHSKRTSGIHSELQDVESEILQYVERREILLDRISRLEICAPASGYVHELTAHTKGGVIEAGATIASVVPDKRYTGNRCSDRRK